MPNLLQTSSDAKRDEWLEQAIYANLLHAQVDVVYMGKFKAFKQDCLQNQGQAPIPILRTDPKCTSRGLQHFYEQSEST